MAVTNPISANQVVSVPIDWKCLDVPCPTLTNGLQAIVDKVCDEPDFTTLQFTCGAPSDTLLGVLQSILNTLALMGCSTPEPPPLTATDLPVENLTGCSTDSWSCASADACIDLTNPCDPGTVTVGSVIQALIDRNVAQGNAIKSLCEHLSDLEAIVAQQALTILTIQSSCCP